MRRRPQNFRNRVDRVDLDLVYAVNEVGSFDRAPPQTIEGGSEDHTWTMTGAAFPLSVGSQWQQQ